MIVTQEADDEDNLTQDVDAIERYSASNEAEVLDAGHCPLDVNTFVRNLRCFVPAMNGEADGTLTDGVAPFSRTRSLHP
jgi:hypothetical protein